MRFDFKLPGPLEGNERLSARSPPKDSGTVVGVVVALGGKSCELTMTVNCE